MRSDESLVKIVKNLCQAGKLPLQEFLTAKSHAWTLQPTHDLGAVKMHIRRWNRRRLKGIININIL